MINYVTGKKPKTDLAMRMYSLNTTESDSR